MNARILFPLLLATFLALGISGCSKFKKKDAGAATGDYDFVSGSPLPERSGASFFAANVDRSMFPAVYFGYDSYSVEPGERGKVEQIASFLKGGGKSVIFAGFTDERGSPEYNRTLGERRAQALREELISMGASAADIQTVSFGEEMPADSGGGESAWAKNRRAEIGVIK